MPQQVWQRKFPSGLGLEKALAATRSPGQPVAIASPPTEVSIRDAGPDGPGPRSRRSWTATWAARASRSRPSRPTTPDNGAWVARKRATVLRFGVSSWLMGRRFGGDEAAFAAKFALGPDAAGAYAIHGGGVPVRVRGVEGVVAVVVVSGLKQHEDHGVVAEVIRANWEPVAE
ncbi:Uncharacterized protein TPAR_03087 [Tolypocladium paradoxum]|uniref:Uncharacterized protein n=1 Tax=Tolypocladium paradoxum TaxID=94208 RepID=A0A2S4L2T5_9HYPO|nr:Uncharacterized protein TPAR_03087 [Tolypocladium paradoxum]